MSFCGKNHTAGHSSEDTLTADKTGITSENSLLLRSEENRFGKNHRVKQSVTKVRYCFCGSAPVRAHFGYSPFHQAETAFF